MSRAPASAKLFPTPPAAEARHVPPSFARCSIPPPWPAPSRRSPRTRQPTSGGWAQPDPAPIGYAVLNASRERVESGTACDVGLYVHDELVGNLQPGASLALNLQPGAVDASCAERSWRRLPERHDHPRRTDPDPARRGDPQPAHYPRCGRVYLAPVADGYSRGSDLPGHSP
ncbi:hypothetical protein P4114_16350 [Pseudomonas aeruginosa]|nr:hypothetical protein [Pseudomonas aeruginosa]